MDPVLHEILGVKATDAPDIYIATIDLTDTAGERYETDYVSRPGDPFGLAPTVRDAITQWIADGKPVAPYVPPPEPTPEDVREAMPPLTARQLRLGLVDNGYSVAQVEAAIAAIADETEREKAQIEWEYASEYRRTHPLIGQIAAALGLTAEQIDAMWVSAASL